MKYYGRSYNSGEETMGIVMAIALIVVLIVIGPLVTFWLGYFGGWLAKIVIGAKLCEALGYLGLTVTPNMLPWISAALAWIGGFFKTVNSSRSKRD
jgi:hypothetical protein